MAHESDPAGTGAPTGSTPGTLDRDVALLFATRSLRLFAYGFLSIVLVLHLAAIGLSGPTVGLLLSLTLFGDAGVSLWITTRADRVGRRRMLVLGALLMAAGGVVFVLTRRPELLLIAAIVGVLSPSGSEVGPFLSIEQAALSQRIADGERTRVFAWYNLAGSLSTALGALAGGTGTALAQARGMPAADAYRLVLVAYALTGLVLAAMFLALSTRVEAPPGPSATTSRLGLHRSKGVVVRLSALFALDAFAGGFVLQSVLAWWFHTRFGVGEAALGGVFFGANLLAAVSALLAHRLARRFGLVNTMVFTHLPSNVMLMLVPLMPSFASALALLLARFSISQMDVPTRQSYTMAVVAPDERAAAAGVTGIARSLGAAAAPAVGGGFLLAGGGLPFYLAGALKVVYDLMLYRAFRRRPAPEESARS